MPRGEHLKQYHFQKGHKPLSKGRPKGSKSWSTELTLELLCDAALIDPETGKRMSAKSLKRRLSRHIWSDARILLNYLDRKLGKPADKVDQTVTFVIGKKEDSIVQVEPVNNVYELPEPDSNENTDS
jgi:hypothetical protein